MQLESIKLFRLERSFVGNDCYWRAWTCCHSEVASLIIIINNITRITTIIIHTYLIFVIFFTLAHFEGWKLYTQKCVNLRQQVPRNKTASIDILCKITHCVYCKTTNSVWNYKLHVKYTLDIGVPFDFIVKNSPRSKILQLLLMLVTNMRYAC